MAKKTLLAASILLLLTILGAILLLRPETTRVSVTPAPPRSDSMASAEMAAAVDAGDTTSSGAGEIAVAREVETATSGGPTLSVVDGRSGTPLEGAAVWIPRTQGRQTPPAPTSGDQDRDR